MQSYIKSRFMVAEDEGEVGESGRVTAKGSRASLGTDENVLKLIMVIL